MIASEVISEARRILHDQNETYRWPDSDLIKYLNQGQRDLYTKRPEFWMNDLGAINLLAPAIALTTDLTISDDRVTSHLANFVVYKALSEDNADTENFNRALAFKAQYDEILR